MSLIVLCNHKSVCQWTKIYQHSLLWNTICLRTSWPAQSLHSTCTPSPTVRGNWLVRWYGSNRFLITDVHGKFIGCSNWGGIHTPQTPYFSPQQNTNSIQLANLLYTLAPLENVIPPQDTSNLAAGTLAAAAALAAAVKRKESSSYYKEN